MQAVEGQSQSADCTLISGALFIKFKKPKIKAILCTFELTKPSRAENKMK